MAMNTVELLEAQRKLFATTATAKEVLINRKAEETKPDNEKTEPKPTAEDGDEKDPEEDKTPEEKIDDLTARVKALEDKLEEKEKETEAALKTATTAMTEATSILASMQERLKDPAFAQACALGETKRIKQTSTAVKETRAETDAQLLAKWRAMPAGAAATKFYEANAEAINRALA